MANVEIYTDGGCRGNPGVGGYGVVMSYGEHKKEVYDGYMKTTNNRMELLAVIIGLELLTRPCDVVLFSDSRYVVDSVTKGWVLGWQKKGWIKSDKKPAVNIDLWLRLLPLLKKHKVEFKWVKGHAGIAGNERCDELANLAMDRQDLQTDQYYLEPMTPAQASKQ